MIDAKTTESSDPSRPSLKKTLLVALSVYAVLAVPGTILNWERLNTDGVSYLRLASYITEGRLADSLSSHWSPMISWLLAPFMAMGADGLHAARLLMLASGAAFMVTASLYLRRMTTLGWRWTVAVLVLLAMMAMHFSVSVIAPDILMAAILMLYFTLATDRRLLEGWRWPLLVGLLGGVAYLGKAYALPFFLIHFPLTLILQSRWRRAEARGCTRPAAQNPPGWRRVMVAGLVGVLGCALVAGPWIGALSWKYGRLTATTAGGLNHALTGPAYIGKTSPNPISTEGLFDPGPGRLTAWETPEKLPYKYWSPFADASAMKHQAKQILNNVLKLQNILIENDLFGLTLALIGLSPLLVYLLRARPWEQFKVFWTVGTFIFYSSGFLLVYVEGRYVEPILWPLGCILCFHLGWLLLDVWRPTGVESGPGPRRGVVAGLMVLVLMVSFGPIPAFRVALDLADTKTASSRQIAHQITEAHCAGPVAATTVSLGMFTSYHLNLPYMGRPAAETPEACSQELDRFGVKTFLVWRDSPLWGVFGQAPSWTKVAEIKGLGAAGGEAVEVYARNPVAATPGS